MVKYIYEKMEDYRRAIKEHKVKRIFYSVDIHLLDKEKNAYVSTFKLTAVAQDGAHFTLMERIGDTVEIQSEEDRKKFEAMIVEHKNKFFDLCRETMPDIITVPGVIIP